MKYWLRLHDSSKTDICCSTTVVNNGSLRLSSWMICSWSLSLHTGSTGPHQFCRRHATERNFLWVWCTCLCLFYCSRSAPTGSLQSASTKTSEDAVHVWLDAVIYQSLAQINNSYFTAWMCFWMHAVYIWLIVAPCNLALQVRLLLAAPDMSHTAQHVA